MKPRIHKNVWGNWNAYLGTRRVWEFGEDERGAHEWLARGGKRENEMTSEEALQASLAAEMAKGEGL